MIFKFIPCWFWVTSDPHPSQTNQPLKLRHMPYKCTFCYVVLDLICLRCNLSPRRGPLQNYRSFFEHTQQVPRDRCSVCIKLHALDPFAQLTMLLSKSRPIEGFFNAFPPAYEVLVPCVVLVLIWLATTLSTLRPAIELPRVRTLSQVLEMIQAVRALDFVLFLRSVPNWKRNFLFPPRLAAQRQRATLYVIWTAMESLRRYHRTRNKSWPQAFFVMNYICRILPDRSLHGPRRFWD